jgi:2-succinyl-6-hydroxy-2,4-cyclohexadiene-1-carboxylate synthase
VEECESCKESEKKNRRKRPFHHSDNSVIHTTKQTDEILEAATRAAKATDEAVLSIECWCLHGAVGTAADWRSFASAMAKQGIATRAVDLWRFLQCESVPMPEFGKRLNADAAGEVSRSRRRILVGYSMGGRLALHALLEDGPWDAAVIISANPGIRDSQEAAQRRSLDAHWATRALTESWPDFLSAWNAQPILGGARRDEREDKKLIQRRREIARSFVDWSLGNQENLWDRLTEIKIPVLWIAGEHDDKFSAIAREAAAKSPDFSLAIAPAAGHRVPWENEAWLNETIHDYLSRP